MADTLRSLVWLTIMLLGFACAASSQTRTATPGNFAVLVFTKTTEYRHDSIPAGITAIQAMGKEHGFTVDATEDATVFSNDNLKRYRAVVFLSTTGNILDANQQTAFETFIRNGGGFVGIHSATDTEYDWPWYGQLVGAYFARHPDIQRAKIVVVDRSHASTESLPAEWTRTDEWYDFRAGPSANVKVLITIDESTYSGGSMGPRHPISWYHEFDGGRAWYTAMGHTTGSYSEPLFLAHVLGGILWSAKAEPVRENIKRGYVIVTPDTNLCCPSATVRFAVVNGEAVRSQATTAPLPLMTDASLFVDLAPEAAQNLGIAMVNPNGSTSSVTMLLRGADGSPAGKPTVALLQPREQLARFVTELFPDTAHVAFRGSLRLQASSPIAIMGLRFSEAAFTIQPPASAAAATGADMIFPQFVMGGGWESEIELVNNTTGAISGRVDVFDQSGNPMSVLLNGVNRSTFAYSIPAEGTVVFGSAAPNVQEF